MRRILLFTLAALLSISARAGDLQVLDAWVRAVPPSMTDSAAFMRLQNTGSLPARLTGGSTPIAAMAMPMETTRKFVQGVQVLGMKAVPYLEIPAHGQRILKPGGSHLMLMNLSSHPLPGEMVTITLTFEPGHRTITLQVPAKIDSP
ncbi:MAG: copper chaperone PCu(A)C [Chthoniobacteraceae bacterium]|jgi:copper(I)-binding protein